MNRNELIFYTQPTEKFAAPQVERGGRFFAPNEQAKRDASIALVEGVRTTGELVYEYEAVQLVADHRHFLFEVPSKLAATGAEAPPILCVGTFEWGGDTRLFTLINDGYERFARATGRTVTQVDLSHVCPAFDRIGPRHHARHAQAQGTVGVVLSGLAIVIYLVFWFLSS